MSFLDEKDTDLHYHLTTNRVSIGTSGKIQNNLIYTIAEVMEEEIKTEIKRALLLFWMTKPQTWVTWHSSHLSCAI